MGIVLKFSEVYFGNAGAKVFDVVLNNDHSIVSDLDIYAMVGKGVAYAEVIPFSISEGMLRVQQEDSAFEGSLRVDFIKGSRDNPNSTPSSYLRERSTTSPLSSRSRQKTTTKLLKSLNGSATFARIRRIPTI